ncbi:MAG: ABC transporter permease [Actinobacteria bacterium]|nr:MAG: ABC transporter permease [Actinomycetota bacterium]
MSRDLRMREAQSAEGLAPGSAALLLPEPSDVGVETGGRPIRSQWRFVLRRFLRHRVALIAALFLIGFAVFAVVWPHVSSNGVNPPITRALSAHAREGPSWSHPFGTDQLGRDQFARVLDATKKSLVIGFGAAALSTLVGVIVGGLAGYYRGWIDALLMRFTDLLLVLPTLAVLLIIATNPNPSFFGLFDLPPATEVGGMILVLAVLGWMPMARIVRGEVLSLREREYVDAARAAGASGPRIILRHLLPNAIGVIIVFATLEVGLAILEEATLSFLGAGIQLPDVSLGNMITTAEDTVGTHLAYLIYFPGLVLFLLVLTVNFIGDGLRDALDPKSIR